MPHQCTNCGRTFADGSKEMLSGCPDCSGTKFQFRPEGFDGSGSASDDPASGGTSGPDHDTAGPDTGPASASRKDGPDESPDAPGDRAGDAVSRRVGSAAATVRDLVGGSAGPDATSARPPAEESTDASRDEGSTPGSADSDDDIIVAECEPVAEDAAQADARGGLATPGDLPDDPGTEATDEDIAEPTASASASTADVDASTPSGSDASAASADASAASREGNLEGTDAGTDTSRTAVSEPDSETADRPDLSELRRELNEQFESIRVVEPGQYELNLMELYDREEYIIALQEDGRYSIQVPEAWHDGDD